MQSKRNPLEFHDLERGTFTLLPVVEFESVRNYGQGLLSGQAARFRFPKQFFPEPVSRHSHALKLCELFLLFS